MKFNLQALLLFGFIFIAQSASTQIPRKVVVEHFTNTRCGICASSTKNPAFYGNLSNHPEVLHISYHPSSPYSNCFFNLHNPSENDGRTKYYGTFGSTPDLIVQGVLNPTSIPFGSPEVFSQYIGQTSEVSITIVQTKNTDETLDATVTITTEMEHNYTGTSLLVGLAEKQVSYSAPNGESQHHDVFRKALTDINGDAISLPAIGESISFDYSYASDAAWDFSEMFFYAILNNDENKHVIQAEAASPDDNTTAISNYQPTLAAQVYPNPTSNILNINVDAVGHSSIKLYDLTTKKVLDKAFIQQTQLNLEQLDKGLYFVEIENNGAKTIRKIIIE